jgi:hypothetical protein
LQFFAVILQLFCSDFADLSANALETRVFERYKAPETGLQFFAVICSYCAQAFFGS